MRRDWHPSAESELNDIASYYASKTAQDSRSPSWTKPVESLTSCRSGRTAAGPFAMAYEHGA